MFVVLLAGLVVSGPSQAAGFTHRDGARDTWRKTDDGRVAVNTVENIDIRKVTVRHLRDRVSIRGVYAKLTQQPRQGTWLSLQTWDGQSDVYFQALLYVGPQHRDGYFRLIRRVVDGDETQPACPGRRLGVDYRNDVLSLSLPRACLENPTRLRWKAEAYSPRAIGTDDRSDLSDDALSNQARSQRWEPGLRRG